jgi:hypothetical protein
MAYFRQWWRSFEKMNAEKHNSQSQTYTFSLHGSLEAGEVVLLDEQFLLQDDFRLNVATILQRQKSPS